MPRLSAFSGLGHLRFSSKQPYGQKYYQAMVKALGEGANFALDFDDNHQSAVTYAAAMSLARARHTLERAGNNRLALKSTEIMPHHEDEYGLWPTANATLPERRAELAARRQLSRGARREAIENALSLVWGTHFRAYRTIPYAEASVCPSLATPDTGGGSFKAATTTIKLRTLNTVISTGLGSPQWINTTHLAGSADMLRTDETITVEPGRLGCFETVAILDVSGTQIRATFNKPHDAGTIITTAPYPFWTSTTRYDLAVLSTTKVLDPEYRRRGREILNRALRGVSQWAIVCEESTGVLGPLKVGEGLIGITPLGTLSI
jgi:hypothetical protein